MESFDFFGGGLSLANAVASTGLAAWLGNGLEPFGVLGLIALIFAAVTLIVFLTELTSNIATTSVFLTCYCCFSNWIR